MGTTSTFCGTPEVTITCCLVQKLSCLSFLIFRSSCLIQKLSCLSFLIFQSSCLIQKLSCLSFLIFRSSCLIQKLSCIGRVSFRETVCALFICNLDIFPLISWGNIVTISERTVTLNVTISERTVTLNVTISERTVLHQIHCDVADKNNGVSFDDLDIHYHWYDSPSYRTYITTGMTVHPIGHTLPLVWQSIL
jgi:hypothetical protein